jgi:GT2 family glycosyltransferase
VQGLLRGFARRPDVGCVTGLVATADLAGAAEEYFDARAASWSSRCEPALYDLPGDGTDALYPYSPGIFGTGASMAFDRDLLLAVGGFDEALGAGTRTRGGEDLDIFVRVLRAGRALAYEPAALVWHHHRADDGALRRQMYGYGTGLAAFVTKCLLTRGTRGEVLRRLPRGLGRMAAIKAATADRLGPAPAPAGALRREFAGFLAGPFLYLRARATAPSPRRAG